MLTFTLLLLPRCSLDLLKHFLQLVAFARSYRAGFFLPVILQTALTLGQIKTKVLIGARRCYSASWGTLYKALLD